MEQLAARRLHRPEVAGSSPAGAIPSQDDGAQGNAGAALESEAAPALTLEQRARSNLGPVLEHWTPAQHLEHAVRLEREIRRLAFLDRAQATP